MQHKLSNRRPALPACREGVNMRNVYKVVIYRTTSDGFDEYCDDYTGILYDTYDEAKPERDEARQWFNEAYITNEIIED